MVGSLAKRPTDTEKKRIWARKVRAFTQAIPNPGNE